MYCLMVVLWWKINVLDQVPETWKFKTCKLTWISHVLCGPHFRLTKMQRNLFSVIPLETWKLGRNFFAWTSPFRHNLSGGLFVSEASKGGLAFVIGPTAHLSHPILNLCLAPDTPEWARYSVVPGTVGSGHYPILVSASTMYWGITQCKNDNVAVLLVVMSTVYSTRSSILG